MTELYLDRLAIAGDHIGSTNPLPPMQRVDELHTMGLIGPDIPRDLVRNTRFGRVANMLPYQALEGYGRGRQVQELQTVVLENELLRATFLVDYGGRLWSLFHKASARELLYVNPVFQPANLGLSNAWFSGGVEWNISTIGHSPLSCRPLHAARVDGPDGSPLLRMYEYERLRGTPFQIDAYLPPGSPALFIAIRIVNPQSEAVPIYWWSNIAVPEARGSRVITPASGAFQFAYDGGLTRVAWPNADGFDASYPTNAPTSIDYFFDIGTGQRRWIAALDERGHGLIQVSTDEQRGRKLFVWGQSSSGHRWQEFLSDGAHPYFEIQAGLARTQLEHVPLAAGGSVSWMEAYGSLEVDPHRVHGDCAEARAAVETGLEALIPRAGMERIARSMRRAAGYPTTSSLHAGSGWGALEDRRRRTEDEARISTDATPFVDETIGPEQEPWVALIESGALPNTEPEATPPSYVVEPAWKRRLLASRQSAGRWLHLGVIHFHEGDLAGAREAWEQSLVMSRTTWTLRNLGMLDCLEGRFDRGAQLLGEAHRRRPHLLPLTVEYLDSLIRAGNSADALQAIDVLSPGDRSTGRVRLLEAQAALKIGDLVRVARIFDDGLVVPDLREGDTVLEEVWVAYVEARAQTAHGVPLDKSVRDRLRSEFPVPPIYDFRMGAR